MAVDNSNSSILSPGDKSRTPVMDLSIAGSNGWLRNTAAHVSNSMYVQQKLKAVLLAPPKAFQYLDNPAQATKVLRNLIECLPNEIEGLNATIEIEFNEQAVGHAGEVWAEVSKVTRPPSKPKFTWSDKYGMAVTNFWNWFIVTFVGSPELGGVREIVNHKKYIDAGSPPLTADMVTITMLFFEPDPTLTNITKAWIQTNMMPKMGPDVTGKTALMMESEFTPIALDFTSFGQIGNAANALALKILRELELADVRPLDLKPFMADRDAYVVGAVGTGNLMDEVAVAVQADGFWDSLFESVI